MASSAADERTGVSAPHPKGLYYLAFTEAWERFSYYGMTALLVVYMASYLLLPENIGNVAGIDGFKATIEGLYGRSLSPEALATAIGGLYTGFVYFTPVLGGVIADRWIGQRNAVVAGALCMSGGHLAMAFDQSFLLALLLLIVGSGLLKGNISAQVGSLYSREDEARRTRGFAIFSMSINVGAVGGPIVCGSLANAYGWHWGFGLAAIFMLAGLATYLVGYRHLPARVERRPEETPKLTGADWRIIAALLAVMLITMFQSIAYYQLAITFPIWALEHVDLYIDAIDYEMPVAWYQSVDPLFSIVGVPILFALWGWQARRRGEPGDLGKIGIGAALACLANLVLVAAILLTGGDGINLLWPLLYAGLLGIAFLYYWPTLLALVSRTAPASVNATMMGICFLTLFVGNNVIGWIGTYYQELGPLAFWLLHAGIGAVGAVLVLLFARPLRRVLAGATRNEPLRPAAATVEVER